MRWVWRILRWLGLVLGLVIALLAWVVFTETGTRWGIAAVQSRIPQLSVTVTDGTFWSGLDLGDLEWSMAGARVSARHIGLRWRPACLPDYLVCVDTVRSDGLSVELDPEAMVADETPAEPNPGGKLALPVAIRIAELKLINSQVRIADGPEVDLERFRSSAVLRGSRLSVGNSLVRGLAVRLPASPDESGAAPDASQQNSAVGDPRASGLTLPVSVELKRLDLEDVDVRVEDGPRVQLGRLRTAFSLDDDALTIDATQGQALTVDLPAASADTGGAKAPSPAATGSPDRVDLPLAIRLQSLDFSDARVRVANGPEIHLGSLQTGMQIAGDRLDLAATRLEGLDVSLPASKGGETKPAPSREGPLKIEPPEVAIPLDIGIDGLTLVDAALDRGGETQRLDRFHVAGELVGQQLTLARLEAKGPPGRFDLSGQVTLAGDWPLNVSLDATFADVPEIGEQRVRGSLSGSLDDLGIQLNASGGINADVSATAQLFTPDIPWRLSVHASSLQWPLRGEADVRATGLRVSGSGDVSRYELTLDSAVDGPEIPAGQWHMALSGDPKRARIDELKGQLLNGQLALSGQVGWSPRLTWDLALTADGLEPGQWRPDLADTRISTTLSAEGEMTPDGWRLDAGIDSLDGRWRDQSLTASGRVQRGMDGGLTVSDLVARSGDNEIRLQGRLAEQSDLRAALRLPRLDQLAPELEGSLDGELALTGSRDEPSLQGSVNASDVAWQDWSLAQGTLNIDINQLLRANSEFGLTLAGIERGGERVGEVRVGLNGNRADHRLSVMAQMAKPAVGGEIALAGEANLEERQWRGRLASGRLTFPEGEWRLQSPASLDLGLEPLTAVLGDHCWQRGEASFCLREPARWRDGGASLSAALAGFPLGDLDVLLPETPALGGQLDAEVTADWPAGQRPTVSLHAQTRDGSVTLAGDDELAEPLVFDYSRVAVDVDLQPDSAVAKLALEADELGNGNANLRLNPYSEQRSLEGEVTLDGFKLAPLQPFLPALDRLSGEVSAEGDLAGSLSQPAFNGQLRLAEGRVAVRGATVPITDIGLTANISGQTAQLDGGLKAGKGRASVTGNIGWAQGLQGSVRLNGQDLEFGYPPVVKKLTLSPDLELVFEGDALVLDGRLVVPSGRFVVEKMPASSVQVSRDEVLVGDDREMGEAAGMTLESRVQLVLGDDVRFQGMGARGRLTGSLMLRQIGAAGTEANGEIRLIDARYEAYGQKLQVRRGRFLFAGPIGEPRLDIEAIRDTGEVIAGLRITGSANHPEVNIFSEPPMAQSDALVYLLTGAGPGEGSSSDDELLAKAAASLGVYGGGAVGSAVADRLGVEDFRLKAEGSGEDTQVQVSGRISPNLVVSYGVGVFRPENTLTLRYQLSRRLFLEAVSGFNSALDIFYSFKF